MNTIETYEALANVPGSFAADLRRALDRYGCWTEKQAFWAHRLVAEKDAPQRTVPAENILAFMDRASGAGLKYPKVKMSANGEPLVLSRAGERAREPGSINVTDGGPFGDNTWYGRIGRDGQFRPARSCPEAVIKVLTALNTDPARTAAAYGQRTGTCCFCRRGLEDYRSVSVGYGPICADKYGLPWGEVEGNPSEYKEAS